MTRSHLGWSAWKAVVAATALVTGVQGSNVLKTTGFSDCGTIDDMGVRKMALSYNHDERTVVFDVAGYSKKERNVTAILEVTAYGNAIYEKEFSPCAEDTYIEALCPIPAGEFSARGDQKIEDQYANMVPSIAFQVPDIAAQATLRLKTVDNKDQLACIQSQVVNGKTVELPAVTYLAVGVLGTALLVSSASAASSAIYGGSAAAGGGIPSPSFAETLGWFQGMAMNGMLSVDYPPVYRSFTKNFGFSAGIVPWQQFQTSIDAFRGLTGGDLEVDSFERLQNTTLVFPDNSTSTPDKSFFRAKRAFDTFATLVARELDASVGGETSVAESANATNLQVTVSGIAAYAQQLSVPKSNTFMTVLLIVAIIIGAIIVGLLLVKVILELWALFGNFPNALAGFREHYWGSIARTITSLILLLYGIWVLYCVFQFTQGDSWAAKLLAGVTLAIFTGILAFFTWKIWSTARKLKNTNGDADGLYQDKEIWTKYSLFYDSYKRDYWWLFVPTIVYLFVKGLTLAVGDGNGMPQTIAQLIVEAAMLALLIWSRPFERKSGNVIGIAIQVVRVLSVGCILVFVQQFGIEQTTKTVTGVVLIVVQSTLTAILVILIIWNGINLCCRDNPHRKRRKEMEKMQRDQDALTPLDARNSLLLERDKKGTDISMFTISAPLEAQEPRRRSMSGDRYGATEEGYRSVNNNLSSSPPELRNLTHFDGGNDRDSLIQSAAPVGWAHREPSPPGMGRFDGGYGGYGGYQPPGRQPHGYDNGYRF